jgi:hypothetical protein
MILGLIASVHWCPYYGHFLVPNAVFCFIHIAAAFYSIYELRQKVKFDRQCNAEDGDDDYIFGNATPTHAQTAATSTVASPERNASEQTPLEEEEAGIRKPSLPNEDEDANTDQHKNGDQEKATTTTIVGMNPSNNVDSSKSTPPEKPFEVSSSSQNQTTEDIKMEADDNAIHIPIIKPPHSCFRRCLKLRTTSSNRIRHLVCYNGFITTYGILFLFWAFWLGSGDQIALPSDNSSDPRLDTCSEHALATQYQFVAISVIVGYGKSNDASMKEARLCCYID